MRHDSKTYAALDRRGLRPLLQVIASAGISLKHDRCWVSRMGSAWIHHYREGRFAAPMIGSPTLAQQLAKTRELYMRDYDPRPGDTIIDLGAGLGSEMLGFSLAAGTSGRVVAVEAHPATYRYLELNRQLNDLANVETVQVATSDAPGEVLLSDRDNHIANSIVSVTQERSIRVPAATLDDLTHELGIDRVDFLKMNIEGAEAVTLRGASEILKRTRYVYVSCHDFVADSAGDDHDLDGMRTHDQVCDILSDAGFELSFPPENPPPSAPNDPRPSVKDAVYGRARGA